MSSQKSDQKSGILLINLGTPDAPDLKSVRRFLKEFLSDPRVLDIPAMPRWLLVNGLIVPFRAYKTVRAYQAIWQAGPSPLLYHAQQLQQALAEKLGERYLVVIGMRYGNPSLASAIQTLIEAKCESISILPLFPQYASASTGSALEKTLTLLSKQAVIPSLNIRSDFYDHPAFIQAQAACIRSSLQNKIPELLLFSYHGLPERQLREQTPRFCYRTQCFKTSDLLAEALGLAPHHYQTTFQSRLGRLPWIKPYTDQALIEAAKHGVKDLTIACPSFVADCLETLEEIDLRARNTWKQLGGRHFQLIPCLNTHPAWIDALLHLLLKPRGIDRYINC